MSRGLVRPLQALKLSSTAPAVTRNFTSSAKYGLEYSTSLSAPFSPTPSSSFTAALTPAQDSTNMSNVTTTAQEMVYPFAKYAQIIPSSKVIVPEFMPNGQPVPDDMMNKVNKHLTSFNTNSKPWIKLFSRKDKGRILPGSVLTVYTYVNLPTPERPNPARSIFSGVLIEVKRRHCGRDHAFRLRRLVGRTFVEIYFKLMSPKLASIDIIKRATRSGPLLHPDDPQRSSQRAKIGFKAPRRSKLFYMRNISARVKLPSVAKILKVHKEKIQAAEDAEVARKKRRI